MVSVASQTYSVTNHATTASNHNHNCSRSCGVRQVAGSHGRGSNRASPSARICSGLPVAARSSSRYANASNLPGAGKGCTNSRFG